MRRHGVLSHSSFVCGSCQNTRAERRCVFFVFRKHGCAQCVCFCFCVRVCGCALCFLCSGKPLRSVRAWKMCCVFWAVRRSAPNKLCPSFLSIKTTGGCNEKSFLSIAKTETGHSSVRRCCKERKKKELAAYISCLEDGPGGAQARRSGIAIPQQASAANHRLGIISVCSLRHKTV